MHLLVEGRGRGSSCMPLAGTSADRIPLRVTTASGRPASVVPMSAAGFGRCLLWVDQRLTMES